MCCNKVNVRAILIDEYIRLYPGTAADLSGRSLREYRKFVEEFSTFHNVKINGEWNDQYGWTTKTIDFNTTEDEFAFKLRFGYSED
jgi:hypothetical protein